MISLLKGVFLIQYNIKSHQPMLQMNLVVSHFVRVNASRENLWELYTYPDKI
jgi:hypothetical protein